MRVNVVIAEPPRGGSFAEIKLSFIDNAGTQRYVSLNIDFQSLHDFSQNTTSLSFDFFLISSISLPSIIPLFTSVSKKLMIRKLCESYERFNHAKIIYE